MFPLQQNGEVNSETSHETERKDIINSESTGVLLPSPRQAVTWMNSWLLVGACETPELSQDKRDIADLSLQLLRQKGLGSGVSQCVGC